jgi:hypothetical protein
VNWRRVLTIAGLALSILWVALCVANVVLFYGGERYTVTWMHNMVDTMIRQPIGPTSTGSASGVRVFGISIRDPIALPLAPLVEIQPMFAPTCMVPLWWLHRWYRQWRQKSQRGFSVGVVA